MSFSFNKLFKSVKENKVSTSSIDTIKQGQLNGLKKIGNGNFGTVYSGVWMKRKVAIKVFNLEIDDDEKTIKEYEEEVNKLSKFNHKNVVVFYGQTQINGRNAFVMELADGSLDKIIHKERRSYSIIEGLRWLLEVAEGVIYMHQNKIIHRDLKPANLLVFYKTDVSSIVKISDFGISREKKTSNLTMTGEVGTPAYMAPEVIRGSKYDYRCDVYSFGIIMWEVFSRKKPFGGMMFIQVLNAVGNIGQRPDSGSADCTDKIQKLMERCWDNDYEKRVEMREVLKNLESDIYILEATLLRINKWYILSRLPEKLKIRIKLASVIVWWKTTGQMLVEAVVITTDDEAFFVKANRTEVNFEIKNELEPKKINVLSKQKIKTLVFGGGFMRESCVFALTHDNKVLAWSIDKHHFLVKATNKIANVTEFIDKKIIQVAAGERHALALSEDGKVWSWGNNDFGQLGNGLDKQILVELLLIKTGKWKDKRYFQPVKVNIEIGSRRTVAVACGIYSSFAMMDNGEVYSWGWNSHGQLGNGSKADNTVLTTINDSQFTTEFQYQPTKIEGLEGVKICRLACGYFNVLAVAEDGSMFAWGHNINGQLGTGDKEDRGKPVKIGPAEVKFVEVAASLFPNYLSVALSDDGRCWVWGWCRNGTGFNFGEVLFPKPVESASINDAIAEHGCYQMTWKTMVFG